MKYVKNFKIFEKSIGSRNDMTINNSHISIDSIIKCIENGGYIFVDIIRGFPNNDPEFPIKPLSIDDDGLITIDYDGVNYEVNLRNVNKLEY